jgi:hypothetical protein
VTAQANGQKNPNIVRRILKLHKDLRAQHGAAPLKWSGKLARSSQVILISVCIPIVRSMVSSKKHYTCIIAVAHPAAVGPLHGEVKR